MNQIMHYEVDLKPLMRISKSGIRSIIGKMLDYSEKYEYSYTLDTQSCAALSCPLTNTYAELKASIAAEKAKECPDLSIIRTASDRMKDIASSCAASSCPFCHVKKTYINDRKRYNLYNEDFANRRLPKSMIRTYLYLYALPQEVLGDLHFIRDLSLSVLASQLHICLETAKRSIETLAAFRYITISHSSAMDSYNIIINDYDTMHLSAQQGGTGYFTLSADMMKKILSITNVNALRLEILKLLKSDDDSLHHTDTSEYKLKDLGNIMPAHTNYPGTYQKLQTHQPSLFLADIVDGRLHFTLKSGYDLRISSDAFIHSFWDEISEYTSALGFTFDSSLIMNICELTREYSITNIKKSLSLIRNDYADTYTSIVNFGALLRSYCRRNFIRPAA